MTKQIDEHISAFMDGELHESEHAAIIQQICRDDQSLNRWQHYHLISDTLRNNLPPTIDNQFAKSVMSALEKEPTIFAPGAMKHKSTVKQKIAGSSRHRGASRISIQRYSTVIGANAFQGSICSDGTTCQFLSGYIHSPRIRANAPHCGNEGFRIRQCPIQCPNYPDL
jgi:hypothetical protein